MDVNLVVLIVGVLAVWVCLFRICRTLCKIADVMLDAKLKSLKKP